MDKSGQKISIYDIAEKPDVLAAKVTGSISPRSDKPFGEQLRPATDTQPYFEA